MHKRIIVLLIFSAMFCSGIQAQKKKNQYLAVDNVMLQIPDSSTKTTSGIARYIKTNFSSETDKSRAIFIWIARNIRYDYANMFAIDYNESTQDAIEKVLLLHSGICRHYAELFNEIANKVGIKSYVIPGYTKQRGFVDYVAHVWCAATIDSTWYLFDPTWGSGFIENGKYIIRINNSYFKAAPEKLIASHMPFDPMWQCLRYPLTCDEFYQGERQEGVARVLFNFQDSVAVYEKLSEMDQLIASTNRITKNGVKSTLVFQMLDYQKRKIDYLQKEAEFKINKKASDEFNVATNIYNSGINLLNSFIDYRNHQFTPARPDAEITQMVDTVESSFKQAREILNALVYKDPNFYLSIASLNSSIDAATKNLNEQKEFVIKYMKTPKTKRKALFYSKIQ